MINILLGILFFLIAITIIVVVHELGHLVVAKRNGVKCFEFAIGMGPKLFTFHTDQSGTVYNVRAIPLGGFVMMAGEEEAQGKEFSADESLVNKTPWQKIKILFAGAIMNFILGWVVLFLTAFIFGVAVPVESNTVNVAPNTPAYEAGLVSGDQITSIDGTTTDTYSQIIAALANKEQVAVTYMHGGVESTVNIEKLAFDCSTSIVGISPETERDKFNLKQSFSNTNSNFMAVLMSIGTSLQMLTNGSAGVTDLMGPVGIATEASSIVTLGVQAMLGMIAFLSINIGVVNIMPFPALDGGRIVLAFIELITRRRVPEKVELFLNFTGFILLMGLFVVVTFSDVGRLGTADYYTLTTTSGSVCARDGAEFDYTLDFEPIGSDAPQTIELSTNLSDGIVSKISINDKTVEYNSGDATFEYSDMDSLVEDDLVITIDPDDNQSAPLDIIIKIKDEKGDTINQAYARIDR
ncbi:RIP metalloprotease RseP [Mollicutes bacterium LVI A0039]|nr:RIP metalloprotease RseP [Mollicutes bacterium LVI A0039]